MSNGQVTIDPRTPILVGSGQITDTTGKPSSERSNVAFCAEAAGLALADTGASLCQRNLNLGDLAVALKKPAHTRRLQRSRPQKRCQIRRLLARRLATARASRADSCPGT